MGQKVVFDGRTYTEPVSRARVISGVQNVGAASSFGNIAIIDTGIGAAYGGGKGTLGAAAVERQLSEFLATFGSASEMKNHVKGGILWDLADYIYSPSTSAAGASTVHLIRAAQTTQAQDTAVFDAAFTMILNTMDEGTVANGVLNVSNLQSGYAWTLSAGTIDPLKYIFKFYRGAYRGVDSNGYTFDGLSAAEAAATPKLIVESAEVASLEELIAWGNNDPTFVTNFEFDAGSGTTGNFAAADITSFASYQLFAGATETYNSDAIDHALDQIGELDNTIFLATESGASAAGTNNLKVLAHINNEAEFKKFIIIGGGDTASNFAASLSNAATLNSRYAVLVHGGVETPDIVNPAIGVTKGAIYKAAMVAGRMAGVEPQVPLTYKNLRVRKEQHVMTETERVQSIDGGVMHTRFVPQLGIVVNQSINTLQLNNYLINPDGSSPETSVERIIAQLNREIQENARVLFIGGNRATASAAVVESFTRGYLASKQAEQGITDGLIISYTNVKATRQGANWFVTYDFEANTPINKIFTTGTIIDPSIG